ncbi:MAG: prepilin-type N-terminal cleavage/methylation domain-containing protein [Candidatus Omnitrophica bacterium]|nr:prepilin-type N-terminal cleavage/methylation domain-containing protein [Candidatus Omnitrophota bacterium]
MSRIGNNERELHHRCGFTFIELMLAVTILGVGIISVIRGYATMVSALDVAESNIGAVCLLKEEMAQAEITALEKRCVLPGVKYGCCESRGISEGQKWKTEITCLNANESEKKTTINEVKITVSDDRFKPERRITILTYLSDDSNRGGSDSEQIE